MPQVKIKEFTGKLPPGNYLISTAGKPFICHQRPPSPQDGRQENPQIKFRLFMTPLDNDLRPMPNSEPIEHHWSLGSKSLGEYTISDDGGRTSIDGRATAQLGDEGNEVIFTPPNDAFTGKTAFVTFLQSAAAAPYKVNGKPSALPAGFLDNTGTFHQAFEGAIVQTSELQQEFTTKEGQKQQYSVATIAGYLAIPALEGKPAKKTAAPSAAKPTASAPSAPAEIDGDLTDWMDSTLPVAIAALQEQGKDVTGLTVRAKLMALMTKPDTELAKDHRPKVAKLDPAALEALAQPYL